jgi:hypothetical protein
MHQRDTRYRADHFARSRLLSTRKFPHVRAALAATFVATAIAVANASDDDVSVLRSTSESAVTLTPTSIDLFTTGTVTIDGAVVDVRGMPIKLNSP